MSEEYVTHIKSKTGWFEINFKELWRYRDLIYLFVKRDFSAQYKQTILGPLWFIINPLLSTFIYTLVFGTIAGIETEGVPNFVYYIVSYAIWNYFATCITATSNTFVSNSAIFGKVYFPRIVTPMSTVIFSAINFVVVLVMSIITMLIYAIQGVQFNITAFVLFVPVIVIQTAILGLGCGIIVSSLTTKYRDLSLLVSLGVQLWMYITPVVYPIGMASEKLQKIMWLNPMAPIVNNFRYAVMGCGTFEWNYWFVSLGVTVVLFGIGVVLFNHIEKSFMDTV